MVLKVSGSHPQCSHGAHLVTLRKSLSLILPISQGSCEDEMRECRREPTMDAALSPLEERQEISVMNNQTNE